jgi:hypothetical protein
MPTNKWSGAASGVNPWDVAGNWSLHTVPNNSSDVLIAKTGSYTVVIAATDLPITVASLTLKGGGNHTLTDNGILTVDGSTTINANTLDVGAGGTASLSNVTLNSTATLDVATSGTVNAQSLTLSSKATIVDDGTLHDFGLLDGSKGTVDIAGGSLFADAVAGSNTFSISSGGTFEIASDAGLASTISFADTQADSLILDTSGTQLTSHITGFGGANTIDLASLAFSSGYTTVYQAKTQTLTIENGTTPVFRFTNINNAGSFTLSDDGSGGTLVACYLEGTRILTDSGEKPIEALAIGDLVIARHGHAKPIKWIGRRSYTGAFAASNQDLSPVLIRAGALTDGLPRRDLYVSPEHALYVDDVLVPARELVNGVSILNTDGIDPICYFHIELAAHDVIYAEGAAAETYVDCDNRGMFHNASEFVGPDVDGALPTWEFCAPVVEAGEELAAIQRRLRARAEQIGQTIPQDGPLRGNLEVADRRIIAGWALLEAHPDVPVRLEVVDNGAVIAEVLAKQYRRDL